MPPKQVSPGPGPTGSPATDPRARSYVDAPDASSQEYVTLSAAADSPVTSVRRTRAGDAWERRTAPEPRGVSLGLPTVGVPAPPVTAARSCTTVPAGTDVTVACAVLWITVTVLDATVFSLASAAMPPLFW